MAGTVGDWVTGCNDDDDDEDEGCPPFCFSICKKEMERKERTRKKITKLKKKKKKRNKNDWKDEEKV